MANVRAAGALEDAECAGRVRVVCRRRVEDAARDRPESRQVHDGVDVLERGVEDVTVVDRPFVKPHGETGEVRRIPGGQVVENDDLVALGEGRSDEVRADEPRTARDEHAHAWCS